MIEWINASLFLVLPVLCAYYYVKSVSIVQLERKIGPDAYKKCELYRILSLLIFIMILLSYTLYYFYPLPLPIPTFPISGWIIAPLASLLIIPLAYIYYRGVKDAGEETMHPKKDGELYEGIYGKIRHPQALALLPNRMDFGIYIKFTISGFNFIHLGTSILFDVLSRRKGSSVTIW